MCKIESQFFSADKKEEKISFEKLKQSMYDEHKIHVDLDISEVSVEGRSLREPLMLLKFERGEQKFQTPIRVDSSSIDVDISVLSKGVINLFNFSSLMQLQDD